MLQARHELEDDFTDHFWNWPCDEEYYSLLANCQQMQLAHQASPSSTYMFLDILTSALIRCSEWIQVKEIAADKPKSSCSSPPLSPHADTCPFESIWPKAMLPVLTTQKGLRSDPSSRDDEKDLLSCSTLLVGDKSTYRDTLSHPRMAHAVKQELRASTPSATVLKQSRETSSGSAIHSPPSAIKSNALAHEPLMGIKIMSDAHLHPVKSSCRTTDALPLVQGKIHSPTMEQPLLRKAVSEEKTSLIELNIHHNAQEPLPHGLNKMNEFLVAHEESFESSKAAEWAKAEEQLDVNAMICREDPNVHAPNHREVSATTRLCVERNTVISTKDKSSTMKGLPIAKVALALPNLWLALSMRAAPSSPRKDGVQPLLMSLRATPSRPSSDKLKSPSLELHQQDDAKDIVSMRTETDIDAYQMVAPNVPISMDLSPATAHGSDPRLASHGEALSSQPPDDADTTTQRPKIKKVISIRQGEQRRSPAPKVAPALINRPPIYSE
jgi:hypothetical protein